VAFWNILVEAMGKDLGAILYCALQEKKEEKRKEKRGKNEIPFFFFFSFFLVFLRRRHCAGVQCAVL